MGCCAASTYFQMSYRVPLLSVNEAGKLSIEKKGKTTLLYKQTFINNIELNALTFMIMKNMWTYKDWVPDKEDWSVVSDKIPVSFLSVELHGKAPRVTGSVSTARLTTWKSRTQNNLNNHEGHGSRGSRGSPFEDKTSSSLSLELQIC